MDNKTPSDKPEQPPVERDSKGRWRPGRSANPGGGQRGKTSLASRLKPDDVSRTLEVLRKRMGEKGQDASDEAFEAARFIASTLPKPRPVGHACYIEAADQAETIPEKAEAIAAAACAGEIPTDQANELLQAMKVSQEVGELQQIRDEIAELRQLMERK